MTNKAARTLGNLNRVRVRRRDKAVRTWLADNDEYPLDDVSFAIAVTELNAEDDRLIVATEMALAAIVAGIFAVLVSMDAPKVLQWFFAVIFVLVLVLAMFARRQLVAQMHTLDLLYDLRHRAPRRVDRPRVWSRRGQVYLAPKGKTK